MPALGGEPGGAAEPGEEDAADARVGPGRLAGAAGDAIFADRFPSRGPRRPRPSAATVPPVPPVRFTLIDRVTAVRPGEEITGVKTLSRAEEYLGDHFPGFAVMPGVLMVEAMVQASAWLLRVTDDFSHGTIVLAEAKAVKFNSFITPGQTLTVTASIHKRDGAETTLKTIGTRDGTTCVSGRLTLRCTNRADLAGAPADAAAKDAELRDWYRKGWAEVYAPAE